jgi:hypothetical protein
MDAGRVYLTTLIDYLKYRYTRFAARGNWRLRTPMQMLLAMLEMKGHLPKSLVALELFGRHGLWITKDYADRCDYLEFYEIDPQYAKFARRFIPRAIVITADSIERVKTKGLRKDKYNFIVADNPYGSPYGNNYYEHFDLLPEILYYLDEGIFLINFIYNVKGMKISDQQVEKRKAYYGTPVPPVCTAVNVYRDIIEKQGIGVLDAICVPRNPNISFMAFVLKRRCS